jgi:hypothetical protein
MSTTLTPPAVRLANLDRTMLLDTGSPEWQAAAVATLSERGSRDALLYRLANGGNFTAMALAVAPLAHGAPSEARENIAVLAGLAAWVDGTGDPFAPLADVADSHRMALLLRRLVANGIPAEGWLIGFRSNVSEADCLAFAG